MTGIWSPGRNAALCRREEWMSQLNDFPLCLNLINVDSQALWTCWIVKSMHGRGSTHVLGTRCPERTPSSSERKKESWVVWGQKHCQCNIKLKQHWPLFIVSNLVLLLLKTDFHFQSITMIILLAHHHLLLWSSFNMELWSRSVIPFLIWIQRFRFVAVSTRCRELLLGRARSKFLQCFVDQFLGLVGVVKL